MSAIMNRVLFSSPLRYIILKGYPYTLGAFPEALLCSDFLAGIL